MLFLIILGQSHSAATTLTVKCLCDELGSVKYKWFEIGVQLGIPYEKLMEFKNHQDPLAAAVMYWLKGNVEGIAISWRSIVSALKSDHVGETGLAKKIFKKYCQEKGQIVRIATVFPRSDAAATNLFIRWGS